MDSVKIVVISGLFGLIGGTIGSLVAPWVKWGIEKRREKLKHKRALIQDWRRYFGSHYTNENFKNSLTFNGMRPYLSDEVIRLAENNQPNHLGINVKLQMLHEINRIEKEWGLM